ncbi:MAG: DUF6482 family protein [Alcanivoracaceae bacterium]|jgi:hypothetical protein|nr:DUF6482 family protein [Alcanivoracaceae bacterium]
MKVFLSSLENVDIPLLRIRSLGLGLYTVEVTLSDGWAVVCDDRGEVLRFTGMEWARRRLSHLKVRRAVLYHASAYHEMIGAEESRPAPLEVPISWPADGH